MKFDIETVKELSALSKIEIGEEEARGFQQDLAKIIDYFALLSEVDTTNVEPFEYSDVATNVLREDIPETSKELADKILANVPKKTGRIIAVPSLREGEE